PELLDRELAVNFKTAFFMCQAAVPLLLARGGGSIVNFASIAVVRPLMHMSAYSAAKSAVAGLTRELAREYRDGNIRVNAVAPAAVRTAGRRAELLPADLSDAAAAHALADQAARALQRLDVLVNSAAIMVRQPIETVTPESWDRTLNVNLRATFFVSQGAVTHLR